MNAKRGDYFRERREKLIRAKLCSRCMNPTNTGSDCAECRGIKAMKMREIRNVAHTLDKTKKAAQP